MKSLEQQLTELKTYIEEGDQLANSVSSKGTYWHIDHSLNVISKVIQVLKESNPDDFDPHSSFLKSVIMFTGYMPRGKGRAPKQTVNQNEINRTELKKTFKQVQSASKSVASLSNDKTFDHPLFGWLTKKETIRFIGIHTHHHLKIIRDIRKKNRR